MNNKKKAYLAFLLFLGTKRNVVRTRWIKEWLNKKERYCHVQLLREIVITDENDYFNYFRMDRGKFDKLLRMVEPYLKRQDTIMREAVTVEEKLAVTLRYLATGRTFEDLKFSALMGPRTISYAVIETCEALIYVLKDYMKFPSRADEWMKISKEFEGNNKFPNCLGALDGKHIAIKKPPHSGTSYYNYKGFFSIVLLALVDANKKFIMVDVGINGRISDGGVLFYSQFGELLNNNALNLPQPAPLSNTSEKFPFVFLGDGAFALRPNLMKPYPKVNTDSASYKFNRTLSSTRVNVENAFGILASRFGVFQKAICLNPQKARIITLACCFLHNFLSYEVSGYCQLNEAVKIPNRLTQLQLRGSKNSSTGAKRVRDMFRNYLNTD